MIFSRLFIAIALSASVLLAVPGAGMAQSLSDASLALTSDWSVGYMGLGSNLGQAIGDRHRRRERPVKAAQASRAKSRADRKQGREAAAARPKPTRESPMYLIAQALDNSGLTVNTMTLQHFP